LFNQRANNEATMKTATIATLLLTATSATAFSTSRTAAARQSTSLNLFGSKPKDPNSDAAKQPGMMDQLAMFKKAQEIAQKKKKLDDELANETITGTAADGNIEITVKYIPPQLPANPTPGYEAAAVNINEEYLSQVTSEDLSVALVEAIRDGEKKASERVGEKYKELEEDMKGIMGGLGQ
jgi:DNA-binding protein YbaB